MRVFGARFPVFAAALSGALLLSGCLSHGTTTLLNSSQAPQVPRPAPSRAPSPRASPRPSSLIGELNFAKLMQVREARARPAPWAGYWWPDADGGISDAASLYEQASGKTGAVDWEQAHHGPGAEGYQDWWGHCNGWAAAAALFKEPRQAREVGGVEFSVGDQKALLSEIAMEVDADFYGERDESDDPDSLSFQDIFPDQFFLVLTNYFRAGEILLMDRYTGSQVWNQAIAGYRTDPVTPKDVLPPDPRAPGITRVNLTTRIWWARDDVEPDFLTGPFELRDSDSFQSRVLHYELWLDGPIRFGSDGSIARSGNVVLALRGKTVIGGVWKTGDLDPMNSHPDYLWVAHRLSPSTGFSNPRIDPRWVTQKFIAMPPAMIGRH